MQAFATRCRENAELMQVGQYQLLCIPVPDRPKDVPAIVASFLASTERSCSP